MESNIGSEGVSALVTKTDAGTYVNELRGTPVICDQNGNNVSSRFNIQTADGQLIINKRAISIEIAGATATKTYNGENQSIAGFKIENVDDLAGKGVARPVHRRWLWAGAWRRPELPCPCGPRNRCWHLLHETHRE